MGSSSLRTVTTNVDVATAKGITSITKATPGTRQSLSSQIASLLKALPDLGQIENRVKEVMKDSKPLTEEEQLKQFIKDYIDEPVPKFSWKDAF